MDLSRIALFFIGVVGLLFFWIHHDSSVVLPLEYFEMMRLCLDYLLDIAMTWIIG